MKSRNGVGNAIRQTNLLLAAISAKEIIRKTRAAEVIGNKVGFTRQYVLQVANKYRPPSMVYISRLRKNFRKIPVRAKVKQATKAAAIRMTNKIPLRKEFMHTFPTIESREEIMRKALDG